jgi:hypothetical protein
VSEVQLFPGVKMTTSGNTDLPPNSFDIQQVILWDIGPHKPVPPKRPAVPKVMKDSKEGDPEYDLAKIDMADALEEYAEGLKRWKQEKIDYANWHARNGGPVEMAFWSCDADDALFNDMMSIKWMLPRDHPLRGMVPANEREKQRMLAAAHQIREEMKIPERYYLSSRTRGHANRPNRGLPEGMKTGIGQAELERRAVEGDADLVAARRADPVFGQQEIRP